jgi:hypothetical protein
MLVPDIDDNCEDCGFAVSGKFANGVTIPIPVSLYSSEKVVISIDQPSQA